MCGIVGCVDSDGVLETLLAGLGKLEYRGYDSAGVALAGDRVRVCKRAGEIDALEAAVAERSPSGPAGIGHTRWSTHGPPTDGNAHPHTDCTGQVAVVHNGIVENHQSLRAELAASGHEFDSDTDTEVIPHLIEAALEAGATPETAVRRAIDRLEGSYAVAAVVAGEDAVYAARNDSPLVLGVGADATYLASDVPAFRQFTDRVVYLADGEFARVGPDGWAVSDADGPVEKPVERVEWDAEAAGKCGHDHFMCKEIHEQPRALRECLRGRIDERGGVDLGGVDGLGDGGGLEPAAVQFVAAGTSYHASLFAARLFRAAGVPAQAFLASEYATERPPVDDALVVGVTQSGETADTLAAVRGARDRGARTLAVTNTVGSTAARECDRALFVRAGPEIGVAATKTFSTQLAALSLLVAATAPAEVASEAVAALRELPGQVQSVLDDEAPRAVAEAHLDADGYFFVGRGRQYPVALEGALKMKEITYRHAEGFAAGELKHGTLALVTGETPVFAVVVGDGECADKTVSNVREVQARGAPVVAVTDGRSDVARYADHVLSIPETAPRAGAVLANVQLQRVAYHTAALLGRPIDKPRNLAKSVTVE
ncbi:MAG: glutamine--fructose-6-phosphate transaminase (isomerizing) [Haloarculaceae archaeon]